LQLPLKYLLFFLACFPSLAISDNLNCPCKVVKVSDGDTVHVLDQSRTRYKIRLGRIDAPEKKQAFGRKSTDNLAKYVAGQNVEVEYNKRDGTVKLTINVCSKWEINKPVD
jgi:endonuclease YncB( thermonuclease family)